MRVSVITPPLTEPISLTEAKAHLRVTGTDDDALISAIITSARQWVEGATNRALGLQTLELAQCGFSRRIELPRPPLRNVVSVKYLDEPGVEQTLALSSYYRLVEHSDSQPAFLELLKNVTLPVIYSSDVAVKVRYLAGLDTTGSPGDVVPAGLKQAMLILIGEMYENREDTVTGTIVAKVKVVDALIANFKVWTL